MRCIRELRVLETWWVREIMREMAVTVAAMEMRQEPLRTRRMR
jgi:hypothetical protein